jgi:hypothetical protein
VEIVEKSPEALTIGKIERVPFREVAGEADAHEAARPRFLWRRVFGG